MVAAKWAKLKGGRPPETSPIGGVNSKTETKTRDEAAKRRIPAHALPRRSKEDPRGVVQHDEEERSKPIWKKSNIGG
jgi:hypothetical protein